MYAACMAAEAWQEELREPGTLAADRWRIRGRRGGSQGGSGFGLWAVAIGLAALAIFSARARYSVAAESNLEGVFGVAFGVGLVVGGLLWFR